MWTYITFAILVAHNLFVNVMKAFDSVEHRTDQSVGWHKWFLLYLSGQTQRTKVGSDLSDQARFCHGIPLGSILSDPLFLVSVNNLYRA